MTFSYFMSGPGLGNLTISVMTEMGQPDQLCQIRGDQQDQMMKRWNTMSVGVVGSTTLDSWMIVITATVGEVAMGDIAIDDIVFSPHCALKDTPSNSTTTSRWAK